MPQPAVTPDAHRRPGQTPALIARNAAVLIVSAALLLLAAACGSGRPSAAASGGSAGQGRGASSPSAVGYSRCMRSHGVPDFPDPPSGGQAPKADPQQLGVSSSQLQAAQRACQPLYPASGGDIGSSLRQCEETGDCPQAMVQQVLAGMRRVAQCLRARGLPGWPDPTVDSEGRPGFNLLHVHGFDPNAPQTDQKLQECEHVMPAGAPVPLIRPGRPG